MFHVFIQITAFLKMDIYTHIYIFIFICYNYSITNIIIIIIITITISSNKIGAEAALFFTNHSVEL